MFNKFLLFREEPLMKWSRLIMPFSLAAHLVTINFTLYLLTPQTYTYLWAILWYNFSWLFISFGLNFYSVDRKERFRTEFHKFLRHYHIFTMSYFTFFAFMRFDFSILYQIFVLSFLLFLLIFYRWFFFSVRRLYRLEGGNYVNVVVVGRDKNIKVLHKIFSEPDYAYRFKGYFNNKQLDKHNYLGTVEECYNYILENQIDEIYCMVSQLSSLEIRTLIDFADNNLKRIKLVPDNKEIFTRAMNVELFGTVPVLNLRNSPLEMNYAKYGKRFFDIIFSSFVLVFILSWLIPLLFLIMRLESEEPLFFKQVRHGYNKTPFWCYKFRSMRVNEVSNSRMCTKNDPRVTRIGKFLRRTNIDELPQFINVLLGEMSVVGPRPHMETHTLEYARSVDKYLVRHFAKPGITGLAQIRGYRGEITCKADIINRTRLDIFYLEKWSPFLDLKIIYQTIYNAIKGDEKAF